MSTKPSPRAELISGLAWIAFGGAIVWGSWTMDRLESLKIDPVTAPGLVPGILGAVIALCGVVLALRAVRAHRGAATPAASLDADADAAAEPREPLLNKRALLAMALFLGFGAGLVGRGLPFWAAAAIFLVFAIAAFEFAERREKRARARTLMIAAIVGVAASLVITLVFQEFFLVRLP